MDSWIRAGLHLTAWASNLTEQQGYVKRLDRIGSDGFHELLTKYWHFTPIFTWLLISEQRKWLSSWNEWFAPFFLISNSGQVANEWPTYPCECGVIWHSPWKLWSWSTPLLISWAKVERFPTRLLFIAFKRQFIQGFIFFNKFAVFIHLINFY